MVKIYYDKDAKLELLAGKVIGIVGYGSQGHAHAQNLRDSGCQVIVSELKDTPGWNAAKKARFEVTTADAMAAKSDIIMMLAEDNVCKIDRYVKTFRIEPKSFITALPALVGEARPNAAAAL